MTPNSSMTGGLGPDDASPVTVFPGRLHCWWALWLWGTFFRPSAMPSSGEEPATPVISLGEPQQASPVAPVSPPQGW